jgi:HEAT repeat protein
MEGLAGLDDRTAIPTIRACLKDPDELVRKTAALSLALLDDHHAVPALEEQARNGSELEKANALAGLVLLGKSEYFRRLLNLLRSQEYLTRSAVANVLAAMVPKLEPQMREAGRAALSRALTAETTKAARSSISAAIDEFQTAAQS